MQADRPDVLVVTNVFRDQLDRYGEVTHTLENIMAGVENSPHATLCLNADDSMVASIARKVDNDVIFYGVSCEIYPERVTDLSDATHCIMCGTEYAYDYITFAHLEDFVARAAATHVRCPWFPSTAYSSAKATVACSR